MTDKEFLLYPLDTGDDPACLACAKTMTIASREVRKLPPNFITFRCEYCGRSERFVSEE
jgi:hypothetical protein